MQIKRMIIIILVAIAISSSVEEVRAAETALKGKIVFSTQDELNIIYLENVITYKSLMKLPLPNEGDMAFNPTWLPGGVGIIFEHVGSYKTNDKSYLAVVRPEDAKVIPFELLKKTLKNIPYKFPIWSPNGVFLAVLIYEKTINLKKIDYSIVIYNSANKKITKLNKLPAIAESLSWSPDSKKIISSTSDGKIAMYDLANNNVRILDNGRNPIVNPKSNIVYYIGSDTHLYAINTDGSDRHIVDNSDWSWNQLFNFSKDGRYLFFIGGGTFLLSEYQSINVCDIQTRKQWRLSKRYSGIDGASLYE